MWDGVSDVEHVRTFLKNECLIKAARKSTRKKTGRYFRQKVGSRGSQACRRARRGRGRFENARSWSIVYSSFGADIPRTQRAR